MQCRFYGHVHGPWLTEVGSSTASAWSVQWIKLDDWPSPAGLAVHAIHVSAPTMLTACVWLFLNTELWRADDSGPLSHSSITYMPQVAGVAAGAQHGTRWEWLDAAPHTVVKQGGNMRVYSPWSPNRLRSRAASGEVHTFGKLM